ncbi:(2Fe-2S)-binding protein [Salinicola salarius]|uniref:(2Fe-2S)-binding protein n=1 Tax=Salinicola salarius TaxID=430457 RepID=UPI0023E3B34F|nr:(2Fe-2S)-binding protein [Salinicola salarius]MDF3919157.1 (2Fe-2S)-binding protein [Salinicola salarius]
MFAYLKRPEESNTVTIDYEGLKLSARIGDTVAAALLASGIEVFRTTPVSQSPRAPWCMMGTCFDCLLEIDGVPNRQGCQVTVSEGMTIGRQQGARRVAP